MKKPAPRHLPFVAKLRRLIPSGRGASNMRVYSNLSSKRDLRSRRKAEYLADLPKNPVKRFLARLHPKRVAHYWFSRQGAIMALKLAGIGFMLLLILFVAIFAYFRKDLDKINPQELSKRVHSSTTKYYDRTGKVLLWEDKSAENRTVVKSEDISTYMKEATVSLEDKDFYKHNGFSATGLVRATWANARGGVYQGGSTITQQLIKNVLLTNERTLSRKAKELILAIEVERLYSKDQILTMYLNEVSYGGNRNGVEAGAREYFGKSARDLTLDEAAMLASIPQRPTDFNPQNPEVDVEGLVARQHITIDKMVSQGYVKKADGEAAKKVKTMDKVLPPSNQFKDIIAPHFVLEVQRLLQQEYGAKLVTTGGLKVTTTLDVDMQKIADESMQSGISAVDKQNGNNAALVAVQVDTGQIIAYEGSRDFNYPGYGSYNVAINGLRAPGSSVKPFDYATLFKDREPIDYTPGSTLSDDPIDIAGYKPHNFDNGYRHNISIRQALAESRNIPAIKAAYISGMDNVAKLMQDMGDTHYCSALASDDGQCYLPAAIGAYGARLDEHTNAYASLARGGAYKPLTYIMKVQGPNGDVLKEWKDPAPKQVVDPQIPYMLTDIMADSAARAATFGGPRNQVGFNPAGVRAAVKTGTTDNSVDGWMMGYSTKIALGVWAGRSDNKPMLVGGRPAVTHTQTGPMFQKFMEDAHKKYGDRYGWKTGDWFKQPDGIKKGKVDGRTDLVPSWFKQTQSDGKKITMDKVSKKKATDCTPARAKEEITVYEIEDPITKKKVMSGAPAGYDTNADDDKHACGDTKPAVSVNADTVHDKIIVGVSQGSFTVQSLEVKVDGNAATCPALSGSGSLECTYDFKGPAQATITALLVDEGLYDATDQKVVNVIAAVTPGNNQARATPQRRSANQFSGLFQ